MQVHNDLNQLPVFRNAVATIGTFDGVHLGHQKIIKQLKQEAQKRAGESVVITFSPHPRAVLAPHGQPLVLLTTLQEKILLLEKQQIDHLVVVPFTEAFSKLSATAYVRDFLVEKIHPHLLIIGYDHHFGHNREGNIDLLRKMAASHDFHVEEIPAQLIHDLTVSSTKIRTYLQSGKIHLANELLGYPYFISGKVVHGDKRGRQLGFPTANIDPGDPHKLIPTEGIYVARALLPSPVQQQAPTPETFDGAANIGHAPTFNGTEKRVEVYLFDFDQSIYDQTLLLHLYDFIRADQKFSNAAALVDQMKEDVAKVKTRLKRYP